MGKRSNNQFQVVTYEQVKQSFESEGYTLLSTKYENNHKLLKFICPFGHYHEISRAGWNAGQKCGKCYKPRLSIDFIKQAFESEGYTLLTTEYENSKTYLSYVCPRGHHGKIIWNSWHTGRRCHKCSYIGGGSKPEKMILAHVESIYDGIVLPNDRTTIFNHATNCFLELDIYLPERKKAIEYNGQGWHKREYTKWKDAYKVQYCKDNGIDLLVIRECDWEKNKDFGIISNFING